MILPLKTKNTFSTNRLLKSTLNVQASSHSLAVSQNPAARETFDGGAIHSYFEFIAIFIAPIRMFHYFSSSGRIRIFHLKIIFQIELRADNADSTTITQTNEERSIECFPLMIKKMSGFLIL